MSAIGPLSDLQFGIANTEIGASEAVQGDKKECIASSRSLSSGAHSRDPLAPRNDEMKTLTLL